MALGLGGIVASGLAGAVSGAGQGLNDVGVEEQKQQALALQQQQLATLSQQTHAVNLQADADSAQRNALPTAQAQANAAAAVQPTVSATKAADTAAQTPADAAKAGAVSQASAQGKANVDGVTHHEGDIVANADGTTTHYDKTAAPNPKEAAGMYDALTAKYNAETDAIRSGNKTGKMNLPDIIHSDIEGKPVLIDKKSGLLGTVVPGKDAIPGETHWFGANDPDKPATPWHVEWTDPNGKTVDFDARYPDLARIASGKAAAGGSSATPSAEPSPTAAPAAAKGAAAGKTVVRLGTDKDGNRVARFSDGSIGPAP